MSLNSKLRSFKRAGFSEHRALLLDLNESGWKHRIKRRSEDRRPSLQLQKRCVFHGSGLLLNVLLTVKALSHPRHYISYSLSLSLTVFESDAYVVFLPPLSLVSDVL